MRCAGRARVCVRACEHGWWERDARAQTHETSSSTSAACARWRVEGCVWKCVEPSEATSERANSGWAIGAKRPQSARRCKGTT